MNTPTKHTNTSAANETPDAPPRAARVLRGLRWWILGLVTLATVINYVDRTALAVMWPTISRDLGLTKADYSAIAILFTLAYAISQSLSGRLYDRIGTRAGFAVSIVVWSAAISLHGLARGLASFGAVRFLLGLGEAGNWPGAVKSNAEWFPVQERALAQGVFNSGAALGSILSPPLIAFAYLWLGWRVTFVGLGVVGVLWIVPWLYMNRAAPALHPWLGAQERRYIASTPAATAHSHDAAPSLGWGQLLRHRQTWAVLAARFFLDPIWWLFVFWLPIYLADRFGFDIKQIGMFAWMPYVGAALGSLCGGWLAGWFIRRNNSVGRARKTVIVIGGALMLPALTLTAWAATPTIAIALISVILFGFQMAIGNIQTLPSDLFAGRSIGSVAGMGGTSAAVGVMMTTWLVPVMTTHSYVPFFLLGAALVPLGVASLLVLVHRFEPT